MKEIPTVRVLDNAQVPTKKTFPPRAVILFLGTLLGGAIGMAWIVGKERWQTWDAADPRKAFAREVLTTIAAPLNKFSRNGHPPTRV